MKVRLSQLSLCWLLAADSGACASAERRIWTESEEPALLVASPTFELHVRGGRVEMVTPVGETNQDGQRRVIEDIDEFRRLYESATGVPLDEGDRGTALEVNGWLGLECVRAGQACGAAPLEGSRALILLRFR